MPFKISILLPIIALLLSTAVFSQPQLRDLKKAKVHTIEPAPIEWGGKSLPFKNVVVVDSRFDTSKLGYIHGRRHYEKLQTPATLSEALEQVINTYSKPADTIDAPSLYVYIKHLWLQQSSYQELSKQKLSHGILRDTFYVACNATLEFYMKKDSFYYPLYRLDSLLVQKGILRKKADELVTAPFQLALQKLSGIKLERKRKQMTLQEVTAYNNSKRGYLRFQKDTLERGIYYTFQDFLHNRMSTRAFEVKKGLTDELYTIDGADKNLLLEFWGFCDGQKQYVKVGFNFYELSREGDTYELIGAKKLVYYPSASYSPSSLGPAELLTAGIIGVAGRGGTETTLLKPLQLNMETGAPY